MESICRKNNFEQKLKLNYEKQVTGHSQVGIDPHDLHDF